MSRQFDVRDHPIKIMIASPVLATLTSFSISLGVHWYATRDAIPVPSPVVVASAVLPAIPASIGSAAGGLLLRRTLPVRILACVGGAIFGLAAYVGLVFAMHGILYVYYTW